jgi:hypothetical protein
MLFQLCLESLPFIQLHGPVQISHPWLLPKWVLAMHPCRCPARTTRTRS